MPDGNYAWIRSKATMVEERKDSEAGDKSKPPIVGIVRKRQAHPKPAATATTRAYRGRKAQGQSCHSTTRNLVSLPNCMIGTAYNYLLLIPLLDSCSLDKVIRDL